jgi:chaperonin GroEL (HSP60 family)
MSTRIPSQRQSLAAQLRYHYITSCSLQAMDSTKDNTGGKYFYRMVNKMKEATLMSDGKVIVNGIDFTHLYNECMFKPIDKHYSKASAKATVPIILITSKCMKIGRNMFYDTLSNTKSFDADELANSIREATKKFYVEEDELIKTLPVTYYTRGKKKLISYLYDSIRAGISFSSEVTVKLNTNGNTESEVLQNCLV